MSGRISRGRGNRHERDIARRLTELVPNGQVITTRDARGGAQGGADLCWRQDDGTVRPDVLGWSVEAKASKQDPTHGTWTRWLAQATDDAGPHQPVVVFRRVGAHDGWVCLPWRDTFRLTPLSAWLDQLAEEGER